MKQFHGPWGLNEATRVQNWPDQMFILLSKYGSTLNDVRLINRFSVVSSFINSSHVLQTRSTRFSGLPSFAVRFPRCSITRSPKQLSIVQQKRCTLTNGRYVSNDVFSNVWKRSFFFRKRDILVFPELLL